MSDPCIICVAITGSVPTKADNPAVPITITEQIESTQEAFEAGATIAHCHVRNEDQTPTSDPDKFADSILFDAKPPADSELPGGNGVSYDWGLLKDLDLKKPFLLSGGLNPSNVVEAIRQSGVTAVDVSSGVERDKGVKDNDLIRAFMAAARSV